MNQFGVAKFALDKVQSVSQRVSDFLSTYSSTGNSSSVELFRLGLQMIASASQTVLQALNRVSSSDDCMLDDSLAAWLSGPGPKESLVILEMMEDMIIGGRTACGSSALTGFPLADNTIRDTVDFYKEHRHQFNVLLTIWDREALIRQSLGVHSSGAHTHMVDDGTTSAGHLHDTSGIVSNPSNVTEETMQAESNPLTSLPQEADLLAGTTPVTKQDLQKLEDVLSWLNGLNCNRKHKYTCSLRQPDTCTWFPTTKAYKEWRSGEKPFLWLRGKAGAGKSVLAASTIEYAKNTLGDEEILVFFYCDFTDKRSTSSAEVMRSLLSQLLCRFRDRGIVPGDLLKTIIEAKRDGSLSLSDAEDLSGFVSRVTKYPMPRPLIIIDALDECTDLGLLLKCLVPWAKDGVRLLVTGRRLQVIEKSFNNLPFLSLENTATELASDISLYVTKSVESGHFLGELGVAVKKEICAVLNRKADGMFRWVQCQIDVLNQCRTMKDVWETLNSLPTGLEETYERILGAIDERPLGATLARRALVWLVLSLEPLRFCQLDEALSIDLDQRKIDYEARPMNRSAFLDVLSSLVIYNEQTDVVTLSHFSVKEYLTEAVAQSKLPYRVRQQDGHIWIARFCVGYLSLYLSQPQRTIAAQPELEAWPMLGYVFSFGFEHLAHINGGSIPLLHAITNLQSAILQHPLEWDRLCELREDQLRWPYLGPTWPSSRHDLVLYILIAYASKRLLQTFLPFLLKQLRSKPRNMAVTNPLVYATDLQKTDHAMILLTQLGSSHVNLRGLSLDDEQELLPLEIAVERNNYALVVKFLSTGCSVPALLVEQATCMPWCSTRVLARLLQTHQFMEWAVSNIKDDKSYRGMFSSGRPGTGDMAETEEDHVAILRRLCQVGCDISVNSSLGVELLERSTYAGHVSVLESLLSPDAPPPPHLFLAAAISDTIRTTSVLRFLICQGVDIRAVSPSGDTGLHLVMSSLWEERTLEATKLLVEAGCDPFTCNPRGETPLHKAVKHGHIPVVKYLLSLDTAPDPLPSDILLVGLESASTAPMLRFLIDKGEVDVHAVTSCGDTALHLAMGSYSEQDCLETVKILTDARCDPRAYNQMGETLIHAAIRSGYISVLEYLLVLNVPLPANILRLAIRQPSSVQMIRLLIAKGADVHNVAEGDDNDYGETVLLLVMRSESYSEAEHLEVVKIIVEAEASFGDTRTLVLAAIDLGYTSVLGYLLEQGVPLPPNILLDALQLEQGHHLQMIRFLVEKGVDLHATAVDGNTVIHLAVRYVEPEEDCLKLVKFLVDAGASFGDSTTLVEVAIRSGYMSLVAYLLSQNIPLPSDILPTSLQERTSPGMIRFLAENGADLHTVTDNGRTVLQLAMLYRERDCLELVKCFVDAGANIGDNTTLIDAAIHSGYTSLMAYLLSRNIPLPSDILLTSLQRQSSSVMIRFLAENGAGLHTITDDGRAVLQFAMRYREGYCLEIVKCLVDAGVNIGDNTTLIDAAIRSGYTSLMAYLLLRNIPLPSDILLTSLQQEASPAMIRFLAENGAGRHTIPDDGRVVLQLAMRYREGDCLEIVKCLVDAGVNIEADPTFVEATIYSGYTSLMAYLLAKNVPLPSDILLFALQRPTTPEMIRFLVENGTTITVDARTVLRLATQENGWCCSEIVEILVDAGASLGDSATLLEDAIRSGYPSLVEYLLSHLLSQNVPLQSSFFFSSLRLNDQLHVWKIPLLVDDGAVFQVLHVVAGGRGTVLHLALQYGEEYCLEIIKILVDAGCDPRSCNFCCQTLIYAALDLGYDTVTEYLLTQHDIPLPQDILCVALKLLSSPRIIRLLAKHGADIHAVSAHGATALDLAVSCYMEQDCLERVKILISAGCNTRKCNSYGTTFIRSAMDRGYISVVDYVLSLRIPLPSDILLVALERCSSPQIISSLVDRGADVNAVSSNEETAFHLATQLYLEPDRSEILEILRDAAGASDLDSRPAKKPRLELVPEGSR